MDDFMFDIEGFSKYLKGFLNIVFQILISVEQEEIKLKILFLFQLLIPKINKYIYPFVEEFIKVFTYLWQKHGNIIKSSIIITCSKLAEALKNKIDSIQTFLLSLIHYGTDVSKSEQLVMTIEDSLQLYKSLIENTTKLNNDLLKMYQNILNILNYDLEHLVICLKITVEYFLMGRFTFVQIYSQSLIHLFSNLIGEIKSKPMLILIHILEISLILFPQESMKIFKPIYLKILNEIFNKKVESIVISGYLGLFSRILFNDQRYFYSLFEIPNQNSFEIMIKFLDIWLDSVLFFV